MTILPDTPLQRLGDALEAAVTADLARDRRAPGASPAAPSRPRRGRRRIVAAVAAALVVVPGAAVAANALIGSDEVARSIPNGTLALLGTHPSCTVVREGVEFDCELASAPQNMLAPGDWEGTVEPTVDDGAHVNGGCRSLNGAGTHWRCYVGQEAVRQQIIGPALLGAPSSGPGAG